LINTIKLIQGNHKLESFDHVYYCSNSADLLAELSRREKHANIVPDPDIDVYMKVI
jgi:hypothetical protein